MLQQVKGFWTSLPGVLTGIAAVITAATGLYIAINSNAVATEKALTPVPLTDHRQASAPINIRTDTVTPLGPEGIAKLEALAQHAYEQLPQTRLKPLVDCQHFPTVNSTASLMSWSNHYHERIITKQGEQSHACNKTIDYRGMAHCKEPNSLEIRQALYETLSLCRAAGIEWSDIKHSAL